MPWGRNRFWHVRRPSWAISCGNTSRSSRKVRDFLLERRSPWTLQVRLFIRTRCGPIFLSMRPSRRKISRAPYTLTRGDGFQSSKVTWYILHSNTKRRSLCVAARLSVYGSLSRDLGEISEAEIDAMSAPIRRGTV